MDNILVAYYSLFNTAEYLALEIEKITKGKLLKIVPETDYSFNYNTAAKEVRNQIERGFCPKLISGKESINNYKIIFVGSPNWFGKIAPPVLSFLRLHSFDNKIVIPFCTHGGGGFGQIEDIIKDESPGAIVKKGLAMAGKISSDKVKIWLDSIS